MTPEERKLAQEQFETALELADLADEMIECRIRRERPQAGEDEIERLRALWYASRPGASYGDGEGEPVPWPRR